MMRGHALLLIGIAVIGMDADAAARIFTPDSDSYVVLKLAAAPSSAASPRLLQMQQAAAKDGDALLPYVEALLEAAATSGNDRYYADAERTMRDAPAQLQPLLAVPRAKLLQHRHEFHAAEQEIEPVLRLDPRNLTARLLRAQIRIHLRDAQGAMQDCSALIALADILTSSICIAQARALRGELEQSYALVATALRSRQGTAEVRSWGAGIAAEIAARRGDAKNAEAWYRMAFELDRNTHYPRIAYAGWLRSQGRIAAAQAIERGSR